MAQKELQHERIHITACAQIRLRSGCIPIVWPVFFSFLNSLTYRVPREEVFSTECQEKTLIKLCTGWYKSLLGTCHKVSHNSRKPAHPAHQRCVVGVFAVHMKKLCILGYAKYAQRRFWSDCANAQSDLNLRWAYIWRCVFWHCGSLGILSQAAAQLHTFLESKLE